MPRPGGCSAAGAMALVRLLASADGPPASVRRVLTRARRYPSWADRSVAWWSLGPVCEGLRGARWLRGGAMPTGGWAAEPPCDWARPGLERDRWADRGCGGRRTRGLLHGHCVPAVGAHDRGACAAGPQQGPREATSTTADQDDRESAVVRSSANLVVKPTRFISKPIADPSAPARWKRLTIPLSFVSRRRPSRGSAPSSFVILRPSQVRRNLNTRNAVGVRATMKVVGRLAPLPPRSACIRER